MVKQLLVGSSWYVDFGPWCCLKPLSGYSGLSTLLLLVAFRSSPLTYGTSQMRLRCAKIHMFSTLLAKGLLAYSDLIDTDQSIYWTTSHWTAKMAEYGRITLTWNKFGVWKLWSNLCKRADVLLFESRLAAVPVRKALAHQVLCWGEVAGSEWWIFPNFSFSGSQQRAASNPKSVKPKTVSAKEKNCRDAHLSQLFFQLLFVCSRSLLQSSSARGDADISSWSGVSINGLLQNWVGWLVSPEINH